MKDSSTNAETKEFAPPAPAKTHLPFLDGVRGFAALWVFTSHSLKMSGWSVPILNRGDVAVDVFMIMSGFLMAYHYCLREAKEQWEAPSTWGTFYLRRFFRIAPLYYLLLTVSMVMGPQLWEAREQIGNLYPAAATPAERYLDRSPVNILTHVTFVFGVLPRYAFSTPMPDWSIGLEMQFYLVFPFIMLFLRRASPLWATGALCAVGWVVTRILPHRYYPMPAFLPLKIGLFMVGILLAWAHHLRDRSGQRCTYLVVLAMLVAAATRSWLVLGMTVGVSAILFYDTQEDVFRIGAPVRAAARILGGKVAGFLADTSYSVYLVHLLVMIPIAAALTGTTAYLSLPGAFRFLILFALVVPPVYLISLALFVTVEKSGIRLGKTVATALRNRPSAGAATVQNQ